MKTFPGFFLIFAVLKSGETLVCEMCTREGHSCSGVDRTCDSDFRTCVVVLVENTNLGKPQLTTVKTCDRTEVCNTPLQSLNMGRGRYERSSVICCPRDLCNFLTPRFKPGFIKPNGKTCPACFATDVTHCGSARVDCSGNENRCMSTYHEVIETGRPTGFVTYIKKGCATKVLCDRWSGSYIGHTGTLRHKANCTIAI